MLKSVDLTFSQKNILYRPTYENSGSNTIVENQYKLPRIETDTFCIITEFLLARVPTNLTGFFFLGFPQSSWQLLAGAARKVN